MALTPIRWDNVAQPQFSNSALAVASGAFGTAATDAGKLAEALHQRSLEQQAAREQDALNKALARMYADGKVTLADAQNLGPDVNFGQFLEKFNTARKAEADLLATGAQTDASLAAAVASRAASAFDQARTTAYPAESRAAIDAQNAAAAASRATAETQRERMEQIGEERADAAAARENLLRITTGVKGINKLLHGTGEGTLAGEAEALFSQERERLLTEAATELGVPVTALPAEAIQKIDTLGKDRFIKDHIAARVEDERFLSYLVNQSNLTEDEIKTYSAFGKDVAASEATMRELRAKTADEERKLQAKRVEWIKNAKEGKNYENVIYNGTSMEFGEKSPISDADIKAEAARLGISQDDPRLDQLKREFPHRQAFRNALNATTKLQTSWLGTPSEEGKREFTDDFHGQLGKLIDQRETMINAVTATPDKIQEGTPAENFSNFVKAQLSGVRKPAEATEESADESTVAQKNVEKIVEDLRTAQLEVDDVVASLPKGLQTQDVRKQLKSITEALSGKRQVIVARPTPYGGAPGLAPDMREEPLSSAEITARLQEWKGFLPTLRERISQAKVSAAEKDELQKFFDEFNK